MWSHKLHRLTPDLHFSSLYFVCRIVYHSTSKRDTRGSQKACIIMGFVALGFYGQPRHSHWYSENKCCTLLNNIFIVFSWCSNSLIFLMHFLNGCVCFTTCCPFFVCFYAFLHTFLVKKIQSQHCANDFCSFFPALLTQSMSAIGRVINVDCLC